MTSVRTTLQGELWLKVLAQLAGVVQQARTRDDVFKVAVAGLEEAGLAVAIVDRVNPIRFRHVSASLASLPQAQAWVERAKDGPFYLENESGLAALVLPLQQPSCALAVLHAELSASALPAFTLFGGVLSTALELTERLERQNAELELVHELAVVGPRADATDVSERALRSVCRSTKSQAAALHRYDTASGDFVMVGDAYGPAAAHSELEEKFRRFRLPKGPPLLFGPSPSAKLVTEGEEMKAAGFEHTAIVPLFIEGQPVGMLTLARTLDAPYTEGELRGAEVLGVQMASLLERARLYDEASQLYIDLKKSYDDLARTQAELVRHERLAALGELAAVMAHEVRNPLGVIFNSLTTLKRLLHPTGDAEMLLSMVGEEADRLNRIVADLLDFARPYELTKKPIAIEPIIASAIDAATKSIHTPQVKVVSQIPSALPLFPVDAHFVRQGLVNLLVNAVQAMPKGGVVTVKASLEGEGPNSWLVIDVSDEGVGLTPRAAEKMFQPFFTTKATGTGLGLAVVKRIVDAHLGEVSARVNANGRGTTFRCRFPNLSDKEVGGEVGAG